MFHTRKTQLIVLNSVQTKTRTEKIATDLKKNTFSVEQYNTNEPIDCDYRQALRG